jgi:rhamnose transport system permease protein
MINNSAARRDLALGFIVVLLLASVTMAFPQFARPGNLAEVLDDSAILILLALGQMLVILTRGIDLSIAANLALSGMLVALFNRNYPGAGVVPVLVLAIGSGAVLGLLNGLLVWRLKLPPIVVTLGTMSVYRGLIYLLSGGTWVNDNQMSPAFLGFVRAELLGLTVLSWLAIIATAGAVFGMRSTILGRNLYAAGGNPAAATYTGIDPGRMQCVAYTICGAIAGLCGYLWVARFAVAYTDIALGFELQVIAACLIGGVAIAGGVGTVAGVVLGCLFIGIIRNSLPLIGISPFWQMGINGLVIVIAAVLSARRREDKRAILETHAV